MMHAVGEIFQPNEPPLERSKEPCGFVCCLLFSFKIFVRIFCLICGIAQCGMGAWSFYSMATTNDHSIQSYLQYAVIGFYGILSGLMIIYAEIRNRWTRKAIRVFIFLANGLARGLVYFLIGVVNVPIPITIMKIKLLTARYIGFVIIGGGLLSILSFLLGWRRKRLRKNYDLTVAQEKAKKTQIYELFEQTEDDKKKTDINKDKDLEMQNFEEA
ncbi:hypothetical protein PPL_07912 [Heterostelium album PN500]|uniref:Uncharacterized protein n=1 Tax=Heterostelium pallidum (strain ATCC 26659 / Pp 5 / PN500) TaxID=670386 RepID=D3BHB0_HETP5|nr:hypothetical protein PPL_07912 [Heterostelium album PN500]EFA79087.1 hypothetical protein PPL_07912 [Heterostelium album PN500]|eukprot:XP_020431209.1 hypothetical protein PPL_07912 [Heterostelium album PN500]